MSATAAAVGAKLAADMLTLGVEYILASQKWNTYIGPAIAEGREPTEEEVQLFLDDADVAELRLKMAILEKQSAGQP